MRAAEVSHFLRGYVFVRKSCFCAGLCPLAVQPWLLMDLAGGCHLTNKPQGVGRKLSDPLQTSGLSFLSFGGFL